MSGVQFPSSAKGSISKVRYQVFTDDHGSPHVHVLKDGALLKITLKPVAFVSAKYGHPNERIIRDALEIVRENHKACFVAWRKIYG